MQREKAAEGQSPKGLPATYNTGQHLSYDWDGAYHIDPDLCGPVGLLIPWKEIAAETECKHQKQKCHTDHPHHLAGRLVGSIEVGLQHMESDSYHDRAGTPVVQAPDKTPECDLLRDELDTLVSMVWGGGIIDYEEHPRDELQEKKKESDAAEDVDPTRPARDRLIQERILDWP